MSFKITGLSNTHQKLAMNLKMGRRQFIGLVLCGGAGSLVIPQKAGAQQETTIKPEDRKFCGTPEIRFQYKQDRASLERWVEVYKSFEDEADKQARSEADNGKFGNLSQMDIRDVQKLIINPRRKEIQAALTKQHLENLGDPLSLQAVDYFKARGGQVSRMNDFITRCKGALDSLYPRIFGNE